MFCQKCGTENSDDSRFCKKCGASLGVHIDLFSKKESKRWEVWKRINDLVALVGSILMLASVFLPTISASILGTVVSSRLIEGDGKILLILLLVVISMLFLRMEPPFYVFSGLSVVLTVAEFFNINSRLKNKVWGDLELSKMVTYESGFYLLILGLIVLIIAVVLKAKEDITRRKARKNKPAAESAQG